MNKGRIVNHARAGKKCMGTVRPGKSSGNLISNGSDTEIGKMTLAKDKIVKSRLKKISAYFFNNFLNTQYPAAAIKQAKRLIPSMVGMFTTLEKSVSVAKK